MPFSSAVVLRNPDLLPTDGSERLVVHMNPNEICQESDYGRMEGPLEIADCGRVTGKPVNWRNQLAKQAFALIDPGRAQEGGFE